MKNETKNEGLVMHGYHNRLVVYCSDCEIRLFQIYSKPENERPIRLGVFKLLPDEAVDDLPQGLKRIYRSRQKAGKEALYEARYEACRKAWLRWNREYFDWPKKAREAFHDKWCGCKYYDVDKDKLIFTPAKESQNPKKTRIKKKGGKS